MKVFQPIEPQYHKMARACHRWVLQGTPLVKHPGPWIMDDFGNSVRVRHPQILWFHGIAGPYRAHRNNPWRGKM